MKRLLHLSFLLCSVLITGTSRGQIAAWNFTNANPVATTVAANLTASTLITVPTSSLAYQASPGDMYATTWSTSATFSTSGKYWQVSITPNSGYQVTLSSVTFKAGVSSSTAPQKLQVQYSLNGFATAGTTALAESANTNTGSPLTTFTLTALPAATTSAITFRIWGYGATSTGNFRINNIVANGTVTTDATVSTDYFRSQASGNWGDISTWQSSHDNATWINATATPDNNATAITVQSGHTVTVATGVTVGQAVINGSLNIAASTTIASGKTLSVYPTGVLTVAAGQTITVGSGSMVILSDATGTGSIGNSAGNINGNVTVERYIPAHAARAYTLVMSPVNGPTIYNSWQEGGASTPGYGTQISGAAAGNGFDFVSAAGIPSIFYYDDTQAPGSKWVGLYNTNNTLLDPGQGMLLFVRGDRTVGAGSGAPMATTLRATGTLYTGPISFSLWIGANRYNLLANPYACAINWSTTYKINLSGSYTAYDPNLLSFVTSDGTTVSPSISQQQANVIQSGQAFFIQNAPSGNPDFAVNESDKNVSAATETANTVFGMQAPTVQLNMNFYKAGNVFADGAVAVFGNDYKVNEDVKDANKFTNFGETVSFAANNNRFLSINARPLPQVNDTLFIDMKQMTANASYNLVIDGKGFNSSNLQSATLIDKVTGTNITLDLSAKTSYSFTTSAAAEAGRLYIVLSGKQVVTVAPPVDSSYSNALQVTLLGNPVKDKIMLHYTAQQAGNTTIRLINANGQAMNNMSLGVQQQGVITIPVAEYAGGIYLVEVTVGINKAMVKVIKN